MINSEVLKREYENACNINSDINQHLPILNKIANEVNHLTELGVRDGQSTRAFLYSPCILRSYDIYNYLGVEVLFDAARKAGLDKQYCLGDSRTLNLDETDALFIDTDHTYIQLKQELELHHSKARKYIIFHDTVTCAGPQTDGISGIGIASALLEFLAEHKEWTVDHHYNYNNGLTILKRV